MRSQMWYEILCLVTLLVVPLSDVWAKPTSGAGIVTTQIGAPNGPVKDNAFSVAIQADGKLVAAGASFNGKDSDFAILRYYADGALDTTFGDEGVAVFDSKMGDDKAYAVLIQSDGKILAAGSASSGRHSVFAVLRFLPDGTLDPNFARDGVAVVDFGKGDAAAYALAFEPNGKIVVGGYASNGSDLDFAVLRLEKNGLPDFTFGENGKVTTGFADDGNRAGDEHGYSLLVQSNGKIVLSGYSEVEGKSAFVSIRYLQSGNLDNGFGVGGMVATQIGEDDRAYASALQPDGKILVAGTSITWGTGKFAVVRYLPNGMLDPNFGENGRITTGLGGNLDTVYGLLLQNDGRIIAGGTSAHGSGMDIGVVRYLADGTVDKNFAKRGISTHQFAGSYSAAYSLSLSDDGKIVAAGVSGTGNAYHVALAKYRSDGAVDRTFGADGNYRQIARSSRRTPITAEIGLPPVLFRTFGP